jgi:CAAX prenyl protease-like protein
MDAAVYQERLHSGREVSQARCFIELAVGYSLIMVTLWTSGVTQRTSLILPVTWIAITTLLLGSHGRPYGLQPSRLRRSWWIIVAAVAAAGAAVLIACRLGTLHIPWNLGRHPTRVWGYVIWSLVQQFILQDYFFLRMRRLIPNVAAAVVATALLFSLAHIPNPVLTLATLFWGAATCMLFRRYRDLYSLGAAHAILGLCVAFSVPDAIHHQMRVGLGYLTYRPHHTTQLVQPQQPDRIDAGMGNR